VIPYGSKKHLEYTIIQECKQEHPEWPIAKMCKHMNVSVGGYCNWKKHPRAKRTVEFAQRCQVVLEIHTKYRGISGYRELKGKISRETGLNIGEKAVYRCMRQLGLRSAKKRKRTNTGRSAVYGRDENLLNRDFYAKKPCEKWLSDVTEIKIPGNGKTLYLCAVFDLYARDIVTLEHSWHNDYELVRRTFRKAYEEYPEAHPLVHTDRGPTYTKPEFDIMLNGHGSIHSLSRAGKCIDNGPMEGLWGILKEEMPVLFPYNTTEELIMACNQYLDYYMNRRYQKRYGWKSPAEVKDEALEAMKNNEEPKQYAIPRNRRIENYYENYGQQRPEHKSVMPMDGVA